ncbi:MAG: hypothetical protein J0I26_02835 [Alphaproteobacteria bacterium]|nr:hypothetical protein [Alphaproteobacteria bacterium]
MHTTSTSEGTTFSQGNVTGTGATVGSATISGQHNTRVTHNSVHRTAFAGRASPPSNPIWPPLKGIAAAIGALIVLSLLDSVTPLPPWIGIAAFAAILLCAVWAAFAFLRLPDYRARHEHWSKSWICGACGNIFVPKTAG